SGEFSRENFKKIAADFINPKKEEPEKKKEEKKEAAKEKKDKVESESGEKPQGEIGLGKEAFDSIRKKLVNDKEFLEGTIERIKKEPLAAGKTEEDRKKRIESHDKRLKTLNALIEMMDKAAEESRKKTEAIEEEDDDEEEEEETSSGDGKDGGDKDKK
ncbi:MAG TPA: hypothetical protein VFK07_03215, partial [Candidatus Paceibacterota bacterium]|nr:hypothetical protein [Candidatus Paceibacterota bacterium]